VKNTLRTPNFLTLIASLGLVLAPIGCAKDNGDESADETTGDGDGDGDPTTGDGDGDGDPTTGDGDGDPTTGDGDGDPTTGDGDGDPDPVCEPGAGAVNGTSCTSDAECSSCSCYVVPFVGGQCGECSGDEDCADTTGGGCTPPNPFESSGSVCNMGELGGGCETTEVCEDGLTCGTVLSILGTIEINTCSNCETDADCAEGLICSPDVDVQEFSGILDCIEPGSMLQDEFCDLEGNGDEACADFCSSVDIMGIAQIGACGECRDDDDCDGGTCMFGGFDLDTGTLTGSTCG
jgi:hypothetical protein